MRLFDIFKKHVKKEDEIAENGMEIFKGEVFEPDMNEFPDGMPELVVSK